MTNKEGGKSAKGVKSALVRRKPPESTVAERAARATRPLQQDEGVENEGDGEEPGEGAPVST